MNYEFKSLEEMARFFDSQAAECITQSQQYNWQAAKRRDLWKREAYAWTEAARVVRNSTIEPDTL